MCDYFLNKIFHCTFNATSPLCTPVQQQHGWLVYFQAKNQTIAHTVHVQTTLQADADRIHTPHRATTECQNALDPWWWWVHVSNLSFPVEWSKIEIIRSSEFKSCQRNHWPPVSLSNSSSLHDLILSPGVMVNLWIMIQLSHDMLCDIAKIRSPSEKHTDNSRGRILDRDRCHALNTEQVFYFNILWSGVCSKYQTRQILQSSHFLILTVTIIHFKIDFVFQNTINRFNLRCEKTKL